VDGLREAELAPRTAIDAEFHPAVMLFGCFSGNVLAAHCRIAGNHQKFRPLPNLIGAGNRIRESRCQRQIVMSETGMSLRNSRRLMYRCSERATSLKSRADVRVDGKEAGGGATATEQTICFIENSESQCLVRPCDRM
jgi:hypothetical protein